MPSAPPSLPSSAATTSVAEFGQKKKKKSPSTVAAAANSIMSSFSDTQKEMQQNQQVFLSNLMQQQQAHTQALLQSQLEFQARLFDKYFSKKDEQVLCLFLAARIVLLICLGNGAGVVATGRRALANGSEELLRSTRQPLIQLAESSMHSWFRAQFGQGKMFTVEIYVNRKISSINHLNTVKDFLHLHREYKSSRHTHTPQMTRAANIYTTKYTKRIANC